MMFELYEITPPKDQYAAGRDLLIEIRDSYKFDTIKAIGLTQNKNLPYVRIGCKKDRNGNHTEYNYMLNIEDIDNSLFALMCEQKKAVFYSYNKKADEQDYFPLSEDAKTEVYYPLFDINNNELVGCIYLCSAKEIRLDEKKILEDFRLDVFNVIISVLHKETKKSNLILSYLKLFDDFLVKNNPHVLRHHYNVAYLCNKIANELSLDSEDKFILYYGSLLHDIGEIYINGKILNKEEKLTDMEYRVVKNHVVYGANLVKQLLAQDNNRDIIVRIIMEHHERYDGKGYPGELKGDQTDLKSRIISIADSVDSMVSGRSYKSPMSVDQVIRELKVNKGSQFDPALVDIMIKILNERSSVKSSIQEIPIIMATLSINIKDNCLIVQGTLIKKESLYEFHPNYASDLEGIEISEVSQIMLSYVANQDIYEFKASFLELKDGVIYLSKLESRSSMTTYSLFWECMGSITINPTLSLPIKTTRISGDALSFVVEKEHSSGIEQNKLYKLRLNFDDNDFENITGMVTQQYNIGKGYLNYFSFFNTTESLKDGIMRRIFRKQMEIKRNSIG